MVPASFSDLAEKVRPGVVNIQVVKKVKTWVCIRNAPGSPFGEGQSLRAFLRRQPFRRPKQEGVGSGFIVSQDGYIITITM